MHQTKGYLILFSLLYSTLIQAAPMPEDIQLAVWANEAIVTTYSYNYKNFLQRQQEIAKYFTASGWTAYSAALIASKLPDTVQKNAYFVSAVATLPPEVKTIAAGQWQATMPLLVIYKNPQYQQKQTLLVTIHFNQAQSGQGVRGLAINELQAKIAKPACQCQAETEDTRPTNDKPSSPDAK